MRKKILSLALILAMGLLAIGCGSKTNSLSDKVSKISEDIKKEPAKKERVKPIDEVVEEIKENKEDTKEEKDSITDLKDDKKMVSKNYKDKEINTVDEATTLVDSLYKEDNIMLSPLSLNMALGMIQEGVGNDEMREELYNYLGKSHYGVYAKDYIEKMLVNNKNEGEKYNTIYNISNSFWGNVDSIKEYNKNYLSTLEKLFNAEVDFVDFGNSAKSIEKINGWVSNATNDMIQNLLSPEDVNKDTSNVLVNTIYFEDSWKESFGEIEGSFTNLDGSIYEGNVLISKEDTYFENEYATAFEKPYSGDLSFIGILPKEEGDFTLESLDIKSLLESKTSEYDVNVKMPSLKFDTKEELTNLLRELLPNTFGENADFSGIAKDIDGISKVVQATSLELDKDGTKAAVATAAIMMKNAMMPIEKETKDVVLDRPFAFVIYDNENNEIVFIGKVVRINPTNIKEARIYEVDKNKNGKDIHTTLKERRIVSNDVKRKGDNPLNEKFLKEAREDKKDKFDKKFN